MISRQSTALYWFRAPIFKSAMHLLRAGVILASVAVRAQQPAPSTTLQGTIRDSEDKPIAQAVVVLQRKGTAENLTAQTDLAGRYTFTNLQDGLYSLRASKDGNADAHLDSLYLAPHESKILDLKLGNLGHEKTDTSTPQFFDQPQYTVAGVKDTTSLGGHGSDTMIRTRDSLAKETVSLGEAKPKAPSDAVARDEILRSLAIHESADLHHQLADLDEKLGNALEAVHHYQRAAEMDPSESYLFDWGAELLLHHAPEPAEEVFSNAAKKYPNSARILLGLGASSFARGNSEDAVRKICQASDLDPRNPAPYMFLGKIEQAEVVPPDELIDKLRRFVTLQPENSDAHYFYAVGLWKQRSRSHNPDAAAQVEALLREALKIDPKNAAAELQFGIVEAEKGAYAEAIVHYQKALETDSNLEEAHYRLAQAYRETGQPDKAKEEVQLYEEMAKESAQRKDRERREIKQFVYTLRDPTPAAH